MKPKFKIDDIVCMKDDFHFNPADDVLSIGKITAIHITRGRGLFKKKNSKGEWVYPNNKKVAYTISGFSLQPNEKELRLYKESYSN